jgi:diphosphomevalonate decarboxylase
MELTVSASAPSNIALIKYMGKSAQAANLPANASLSYTLENLRTFVTLEEIQEPSDRWEPLPGYTPLNLSDKGKAKFLGHFGRLKDAWRVKGHYLVRSANNFPSDCGLASSASSFAALTLAAYEVAHRENGATLDPESISRWSRLGSGSSCRSLFSPWSLWRAEGAEAMSGLPETLHHAVVLVQETHKEVSSSEAHQRVPTSRLYRGRSDRAEARLQELVQALRGGDWGMAYELCWAEFEDMHALFESSAPPFTYRTPETHEVLGRFQNLWRDKGDGPIVTMDAGANVHLLLRADQRSQAEDWLSGLKYIASWDSNK